MKKILLLTTGGTIASVASPSGVHMELEGEAILEAAPELAQLANCTAQDLFMVEGVQLGVKHWQKIAKAISASYAKYDGFVVTAGTEALSYLAAALGRMLLHLNKPVVLTGSFQTLEVANSDARLNLQLAFSMAVGHVPGVCVAFGNKVIAGNNVKQLFSKNANAFESMNAAPLICFTKEGIKKHLDFEPEEGELTVLPAMEEKVLTLKITPELDAALLPLLVAQGYKGLVLEVPGTGCVPAKWVSAIKKAVKDGLKIIVVSQCSFDGTDLAATPSGKSLQATGVIDGKLLTAEAAQVALMWSLANVQL